jgi:hypothetical protein
MKSRIEKLEAIAESAKTFLEQHKRIVSSEEYIGIFTDCQVRGAPYNGEQFNDKALKSALEALKEKDAYKCGICDKDESDVVRMIASGLIYICNECIEICVDILEDAEGKTEKITLPKENLGEVMKQKMDKIGKGDKEDEN